MGTFYSLLNGRRAGAVQAACFGLVLLAAQPAVAQEDLAFFKNYFVTGDYVVGGVSLRGTGVGGIATGSISISGVPARADILAAFLYWQTVSDHRPRRRDNWGDSFTARTSARSPSR